MSQKGVPPKPPVPTPHIRSGERKVVFCYDVGCPHAYIASQLVDKLAHEYHAKLEWWPVLLSGLHVLDDAPQNVEPPAKLRYIQQDLIRQAARHNVTLNLPDPSQHVNSLAAMQAIAAVQGDERVKLTHELFKRRWVDNEDISSEAVIAAAITACAIDPKHVNRSKGKDTLAHSTQHAHDMGAPGTPTFFIYASAPTTNRSTTASTDVFFAPTMLYGADRLPFLWHALGDEAGQVERVTADPALLAGRKPQVELFMDMASPSAFLAWTQLGKIRHLCDVTVTLVVIGGVLKAVGGKPPLERLGKNGKKQFMTDLQDWAEFLHEKCTIPPFFPVNTMLADRCALVEPRLIDPLLRALWQRSLDISDKPRLLQLIGEAGFNAETVWKESQSAAVKEKLKANGERAVELGVFGVPSFVLDGEVLFGQDRMDVLMDRLSGWQGGKSNSSSGGGGGVGKTSSSGKSDDGRAGRPTPAQRKGKETETVVEDGKRGGSGSKQGIKSNL